MNNLVAKGLVVTTLAILATAANAEVYKWINDQGEVEYSDQYREGAEKITIAPLSTIQMPKSGPQASSQVSGSAEKAQLYSKLAITFPENDSALHAGSGSITVTTAVQPALLPSHSLRLSIDGKAAGVSQDGTFSLADVDRGTHTLTLDVVDSTSVIQSAESVSFTLHRPSALRPTKSAPN